MMIYPIDQKIEDLLNSFVDEETGELKEFWTDPDTGKSYILTEDLMNAEVEMLHMEFADIIHNLRNEVINCTAEAEAIKEEKRKLDDRKKRAENAAERAKKFLAYLTKGEKYSDGAVKISYRKSTGLIIEDEDQLRDWAKQNGPGFLKEPELLQGDIKTAIMNGQAIPFAYLEERNNIQVK